MKGVKVTFYKFQSGRGQSAILKINEMKNTILQNRGVANDKLYKVEGLNMT